MENGNANVQTPHSNKMGWTCKLCEVSFVHESVEQHVYRNHLKPNFGGIKVYTCGECMFSGEGGFEEIALHCISLGHEPTRVSKGLDYDEYAPQLFSALEEIMVIHPNNKTKPPNPPERSPVVKRRMLLWTDDDQQQETTHQQMINDQIIAGSNNDNQRIDWSSLSGEEESSFFLNNTDDEQSFTSSSLIKNNDNLVGDDKCWEMMNAGKQESGEKNDSTTDEQGKDLDKGIHEDGRRKSETVKTEKFESSYSSHHQEKTVLIDDPLSLNSVAVVKDSADNDNGQLLPMRPLSVGNKKRSPLKAFKNGGIRNPLSCSYCTKTFQTKAKVVIHERVHTGEKPYSCSVCGKAFSQTNSLEYHMRTHTGIKPFECGTCGKTFIHAGKLRAHLRESKSNCSFGRKHNISSTSSENENPSNE